MDANEMLTLTCQRLKEEAGRPPDFAYGDLAAVKQAQAGEVCDMFLKKKEKKASNRCKPNRLTDLSFSIFFMQTKLYIVVKTKKIHTIPLQ